MNGKDCYTEMKDLLEDPVYKKIDTHPTPYLKKTTKGFIRKENILEEMQ